jgi:hypothetical protein
MRDIAFLVRLPEEATGIQRSRRLLEELLQEDEIRSQEKQTRKEISSVMQGNLRGEGRRKTSPYTIMSFCQFKQIELGCFFVESNYGFATLGLGRISN